MLNLRAVLHRSWQTVVVYSQSVFGRLLLIFLTASLMTLLLAALVLQQLAPFNPRNLLLEQLLGDVFHQTASCPQQTLQQVADRFHWGIIMGGPDCTWASRTTTPSLASLDKVTPSDNLALFWHAGERWLVYRQGAGRYYISGFKMDFPAAIKLTLFAGLLALLLLFYLFYRAVLGLFSPLRQLHAGANHIASGALTYRISTDRRDELGELTRSVNNMADRLQAILEEKHQLLLAMGHELRTPLARTRLLLELLPPSADRDQLQRNVREMSELVASLLETEALSGGHITVRRQPVVVAELLRSCLERIGCKADVSLAEDLPPLAADAFRLGMVMDNLLSNAVKYGGGDVRVRVQRQDEHLSIAVCDNGEGIDPAIAAQLGRPFFRPDCSRSRKTGGYGLGLYLCRVIVEGHGGRLVLRSQPGQGTEAEILLPLP